MIKPQPPKISMSPVKSSAFTHIGHDKATNTMAITFNGGDTHHYAGVNAKQFADFQNAKSLGSHFSQHIKGLKSHKLPPKNG